MSASSLYTILYQVLEDFRILLSSIQEFSPSYLLLWLIEKCLCVFGCVRRAGWLGQAALGCASLVLWALTAARINRVFTVQRVASSERLDHKTVLVTGCNRGCGLMVATQLAARGATIILACRNMQKGERALQRIRSITKSDRLSLVRVDFSDMSSVRHLANQVLASQTKLDVLICNGSVSLTRLYRTESGLEVHFATNYLGFFLLSNLLLSLISTSDGRILLPASSGAMWSADLNPENFNSQKEFLPQKAYANSQLANLVFAKHLARKCQTTSGVSVTVNCFDKESPRTGWSPASPGWWTGRVSGAETATHLAVSADGKQSTGGYFSSCRPAKVPAAANDELLAEKLWNFSTFCTNLQPDETILQLNTDHI